MAQQMSPRPASARPAAAAARPALPASRYLRDILWAARIVAGIVILVASRSWPAYWHQISFLVILAVVTYPARSVRWGTVYNFFLVGFVFAWAVVGVQYLIEQVIFGGHLPLVGSVLIAPLTEEIGKVLPLVVMLAGWRGVRNSYGACDLMLCGGALGCGFGLLEDTFRAVHSYPTPSSPALFGVAFFPDSYDGFLGHGASTAFVALALGFLVYALRWRRWLIPGLVAAVLALFWMMVDHALANFATFNSFSQPWMTPVRWIWRLDQNGRLSPYVLLALILLTVAVERLLLWRALRGLRRLPASAWFAYWKRPLQRGWGYPQLRAMVLRLWAFLLYVTSYRRLAYLTLHWKGDTPPPRKSLAPLIASYTGKVVVAQLAARQS